MRRKIEIKLIEDKSKRHTTFTKRRKGLMKKAEEFCRKSDSTAVLVTFSTAGNCYGFGHPDVDSVLDRYLADSASALEPEAATSGAEERVHGGEEEEEEEEEAEVQRRIGDAVESGRWVEAVRGLGLDELDEVFAELENIRRKMEALERKIAAAAAEEGSGSSGGNSGRSC